MKSIFLPLILICGLTQLPAFSQGVVTTTNPFTFSPVAAPQPIVGSPAPPVVFINGSSPLRPLRSFYPKTQIQNPSNPWLPPNLGQVNTGLTPVGSISPTSPLVQPTSSLNTPGSIQQAGFPTVPTYNIGTATPTSQGTVTGSGNAVPTSIGNPTNPLNFGGNLGTSTVNFNAASRTNPINPLNQFNQ